MGHLGDGFMFGFKLRLYLYNTAILFFFAFGMFCGHLWSLVSFADHVCRRRVVVEVLAVALFYSYTVNSQHVVALQSFITKCFHLFCVFAIGERKLSSLLQLAVIKEDC